MAGWGRQSKNNFKTRFLFGGTESKEAQQGLDLWLLCSRFSSIFKAGPVWTTLQK